MFLKKKNWELTYLPPVPVRSFWHHGWRGSVYRSEQQTAVLFRGSPAWGSQTMTRALGRCSRDRQSRKLIMIWLVNIQRKNYNFKSQFYLRSKMASHLNGCSWQDDSEVGSQLLNGFGKFGFPILDDMTLIKNTVIEFDISEKLENLF